MSHLLSSEGGLSKQPTGVTMWNPFKHNTEHDDIAYLLSNLTIALYALQQDVKELREEVDYLVDFLDD